MTFRFTAQNKLGSALTHWHLNDLVNGTGASLHKLNGMPKSSRDYDHMTNLTYLKHSITKHVFWPKNNGKIDIELG